MPKLICNSLSYSTTSWCCQYNVTFESGRCYVVCGPSGSGKSTLANLIAGFLPPSAGSVIVDETSLSDIPPHRRGINYMGQVDGLFPGISIMDNLILTLHDSKLSASSKKEKILDLTKSLDLDRGLLARRPSQVSGGQLSRCNLARALLRPGLWLLLDEPFAAVDRPTRLQILRWLKGWMHENNSTIILISHDLDDIFTIATDITVINDGKVVENTSLNSAIAEPKSVITARLLRSGLVLSTDNGSQFVSSRHIFTSQDEMPNIPSNFLRSHSFQAPQITNLGHWMRIVDLNDCNDLTLPHRPDFANTVWFDSRHAMQIK